MQLPTKIVTNKKGVRPVVAWDAYSLDPIAISPSVPSLGYGMKNLEGLQFSIPKDSYQKVLVYRNKETFYLKDSLEEILVFGELGNSYLLKGDNSLTRISPSRLLSELPKPAKIIKAAWPTLVCEYNKEVHILDLKGSSLPVSNGLMIISHGKDKIYVAVEDLYSETTDI